MLLQLHSDASYMNEPKACSTAGGHYFLGDKKNDKTPTFLNGAIHTLCTILKHVAASTTEAELEALFLNTQELTCLRTAFKTWDIHNHQPQYTVTTYVRLELSRKTLNNKDHEQWI